MLYSSIAFKRNIIRFFDMSAKFLLFVFYKIWRKNSKGHLNIQKFNTAIQEIALRMMNYMGDGSFENSGERDSLDYVKKSLRYKYPNCKLFLFDVGANVGSYSLELIRCFGDNVVVHAFEPLDSTYNKLEDNIKTCKDIVAHNLGLSNKVSVIPIYTSELDCDQTSSVYQHNKDHYGMNMNIKKDCQFTTIDDFCFQNKLNHIHFLKVDVEGHEKSVLEGAKSMIERGAIDYIQFEFGVFDIESRTFFQDFWYMLKDKYNIYRIVKGGIIPIVKYREQLEIFQYSNYLAELRK